MRLLFLAPQPFFQERGTPIAVRLALRVLSERTSDDIDLLTFTEGETVEVGSVKVFRIWTPSWFQGIRPGFSVKKLCCDVIFFVVAARMILRAKLQRNPYHLIHAVEESVFMALLFKWIFRIPYIYDMDSSMAMQLIEKLPWLLPLRPLFDRMEAQAIASSLSVIPVCDALAEIAQTKKATHIKVLPDISLESQHTNEPSSASTVSLRAEAGLADLAKIILYVGNLESYQGVDLLVESFAQIRAREPHWHLVIIGGAAKHVEQLHDRIERLKAAPQIHALGPRPVSKLGLYLRQADILASPRVKGNNTPMKIYSYMHSGVPIVATDLPTHTQVLDKTLAMLANPDIDDFSSGLLKLMQSEETRQELAKRAFALAEQKYTFPVFRNTLLQIYDEVGKRINP